MDDDEHCFYRIGGERVLLLSTSSWAMMTAITPLLVNIGLRPLVTMTVTRFLLGVMQGEGIVRDIWGENCQMNEGNLERKSHSLKKMYRNSLLSINMFELEISTNLSNRLLGALAVITKVGLS